MILLLSRGVDTLRALQARQRDNRRIRQPAVLVRAIFAAVSLHCTRKDEAMLDVVSLLCLRVAACFDIERREDRIPQPRIRPAKGARIFGAFRGFFLSSFGPIFLFHDSGSFSQYHERWGAIADTRRCEWSTAN